MMVELQNAMLGVNTNNGLAEYMTEIFETWQGHEMKLLWLVHLQALVVWR